MVKTSIYFTGLPVHQLDRSDFGLNEASINASYVLKQLLSFVVAHGYEAHKVEQGHNDEVAYAVFTFKAESVQACLIQGAVLKEAKFDSIPYLLMLWSNQSLYQKITVLVHRFVSVLPCILIAFNKVLIENMNAREIIKLTGVEANALREFW